MLRAFHQNDTMTSNAVPPKSTQKPLSIWKLLLISLPSLGISYSWASQIGLTSPFLLSLGMPETFLSYSWLAGPISGTILQPIIGLLSDRIWVPGLGVRRQLYLWLGALLCLTSMLTFSWSDWIGCLLSMHCKRSDEGGPMEPSGDHRIGLIVAVTSFFLLDLGVNFVQGPLRMLLLDLAPPEQHTLGSSLFALFNGIGNTLGFVTGTIPFTRLKFLHVDHTVRPVYLLGAVVMVLVVAMNGIFVREKKELPGAHGIEIGDDQDDVESTSSSDASKNLKEETTISETIVHTTPGLSGNGKNQQFSYGDYNYEDANNAAVHSSPVVAVDDLDESSELFQLNTDSASSSQNTGLLYRLMVLPVNRFLYTLKTIPSCVYVSFLVQCCCYMAKFALYIYGSVYFATQVFGGDCHASIGTEARKKCDDGVLWANFALSIMAFLSIFLAPLIAWLSNYVSIKWIWMVGQLVEGISLCSCAINSNVVIAVIAFASMSITLTCMMSIPWSLCSAAIRERQIKLNITTRQEGLFLAAFNLSQCLPEFVVGIAGGMLVHLFVDTWNFHIGSQLAIFGFLGGFGGAVLLLFVRVPESLQPRKSLIS